MSLDNFQQLYHKWPKALSSKASNLYYLLSTVSSSSKYCQGLICHSHCSALTITEVILYINAFYLPIPFFFKMNQKKETQKNPYKQNKEHRNLSSNFIFTLQTQVSNTTVKNQYILKQLILTGIICHKPFSIQLLTKVHVFLQSIYAVAQSQIQHDFDIYCSPGKETSQMHLWHSFNNFKIHLHKTLAYYLKNSKEQYFILSVFWTPIFTSQNIT